MIFKIGNNSHEAADVNLLSHQKQYRHTPKGGRTTRVETLHIRCTLKNTSAALIKADILEVQGWYANDGNPAGLYYDDNSASPHVLTNSGTLDGVKVMRFAYMHDSGAELSVGRTLDVVLQAEYIDVSDQIAEFRETLTYVGNGGARSEMVQTFIGPLYVGTALTTPVHLHQEGYAVGIQAYPELTLHAPKFPNYELRQHRELEYIGAERGVLNRINYGMRWKYVMALPTFLQAYPTLR